MTQVLYQDILNKTNDYARNYTVGNVDLGNRARAINEAIAYFQRRLGLPSDEFVQSFYYVTGTNYYNLNADFNEAVDLIFHNYQYNTPQNQFTYRKYPDILRIAGMNPQNRYFSFVTYNTNAKQLLMVGPNLNGGSLLDSFDNAIVSGWVGAGDANSLALDPNIKTEGSNSLKFNITYSSGVATLSLPTYQSSQGSDFTNWLNLNAWFELDIYFASVAFTSVQLQIISSAGNYYTMTATANADGSAFTANQWNTVAFKFNAAVATGSPVITAINALKIVFNESGTSNITNMRVDNLKVVIPDYLDLIYYTNFKGLTHGAAGVNTYLLANTDDTANFGAITPDLVDPVAKYAATILMPQLRQDPNLRIQYLKELGIDPETMNDQNFIRMWGKVYPRKRIINLGKTKIRRGQQFATPVDNFGNSH